MRTKDEILNEARKGHPAPSSWDSTASLNERLTIEALLDIRDQLTAITKDLVHLNEYLSEHA